MDAGESARPGEGRQRAILAQCVAEARVDQPIAVVVVLGAPVRVWVAGRSPRGSSGSSGTDRAYALDEHSLRICSCACLLFQSGCGSSSSGTVYKLDRTRSLPRPSTSRTADRCWWCQRLPLTAPTGDARPVVHVTRRGPAFRGMDSPRGRRN